MAIPRSGSRWVRSRRAAESACVTRETTEQPGSANPENGLIFGGDGGSALSWLRSAGLREPEYPKILSLVRYSP